MRSESATMGEPCGFLWRQNAVRGAGVRATTTATGYDQARGARLFDASAPLSSPW